MTRKTVSLEELDNLEVDEDDILYWKGRRLKTHSVLDLTTAQATIAIIAAASAFSMAATDLWRFACDAGWWALSCPLK